VTIRVAVIGGDGIGPGVTEQACRVLEAVRGAGLADLEMTRFPHGADHYLATGETMSDETFARLRDDFDCILFGSVGDPRVPKGEHARDLLLGLRTRLDLYVNWRPVRLRAADLSPLKDARAADLHMEILRENTEGLYSGAGRVEGAGTPREVAYSTGVATRHAVERITRFAFQWAEREERPMAVADKANAVPHMWGLWRRVFGELQPDFPGVASEAMHIDALVMEMVRSPARFGIVLASNLLGDIISDLGTGLVGGPGVAPSANFRPEGGAAGAGGPRCSALYEPVHGTAPDIAGQGKANPMAAVLSGALLLRRHGFGGAAQVVETSVEEALAGGVRTPDLGGSSTTQETGDWLCRRISNHTATHIATRGAS